MEPLTWRLVLGYIWETRAELVAYIGMVLSQLATSGLIEDAKTVGWISFSSSAMMAAVVHGNKWKARKDAKATEQD